MARMRSVARCSKAEYFSMSEESETEGCSASSPSGLRASCTQLHVRCRTGVVRLKHASGPGRSRSHRSSQGNKDTPTAVAHTRMLRPLKGIREDTATNGTWHSCGRLSEMKARFQTQGRIRKMMWYWSAYPQRECYFINDLVTVGWLEIKIGISTSDIEDAVEGVNFKD
eukprot:5029096-Amphidinium_carterae.1